MSDEHPIYHFRWCYTLWMALLYSEFQIFSSPSPAITTAPQINWNLVNVHLFELAVKSVLSYEIQKNNSRGISHRQSGELCSEKEACRRK